MIKISPSILASDLANLEHEVAAMVAARADMIHIDVMDGHFVPNISFGVPVIASLRKKTGILFDVHLMISDPLRYVQQFAQAGADLITFHLESDSSARETIAAIRKLGKKAGLSIKPDTPADTLYPFLQDLDMVLVMTVEPGFGGQKFMADLMPKLRMLRNKADELSIPLDIQVDGGIDFETAATAASYGANVFVAGSSLFQSPDYAGAVRALRKSAREGLLQAR